MVLGMIFLIVYPLIILLLYLNTGIYANYGYLEVRQENNMPIPIPEAVDKYSGKFVVRLPKSLHRRLAIEAEKEGVSLNQLALYKLAL